MNTGRAAAFRRLAPLALLVLGVHLLLLRAAPPQVRPGKDPPARFATRTVALPLPPPAPVAPSATPALESLVATPARRARAPALRPAPPPPDKQEPQPAAPAQKVQAVPATAPAKPFTPKAIAVPAPARLRYEVTATTHRLTLSGVARFQWHHDGKQYEASLEISSPGLPRRSQRSEGRITEEGLAPSYFSDKGRSEQATHFDREQGRIVFSNNRPQATLEAGVQDRLSVIVQLAALIAAQPERYPAGTQVSISTASTREVEPWIFTVEGEEDLRLPGGEIRALKLQRLPRGEYDQKLELWLARRMDYAPVRLRLTNPNGDGVDQRWSATDKG